MDFLIVFVIIVGFTLLEVFFDIGVMLLLKRLFNKKSNDNNNIAAIIIIKQFSKGEINDYRLFSA